MNPCFTTSSFIIMDIPVIFTLWSKIHQDLEGNICEPYMQNILITNIIISIVAAINIGISKHFIESETKLIGQQILNKILSDHCDFIDASLFPKDDQ